MKKLSLLLVVLLLSGCMTTIGEVADHCKGKVKTAVATEDVSSRFILTYSVRNSRSIECYE